MSEIFKNLENTAPATDKATEDKTAQTALEKAAEQVAPTPAVTTPVTTPNAPVSDPEVKEEVEEKPEDDEEEEAAPDERSMLMNRARLMGITFSNNIGTDTLKEKIKEKLSSEAKTAETAPVTQTSQTSQPSQEGQTAQDAPKKARPKSLRERLLEENMKLVRVRITNLDPKKKDLPGEIITVANEYLGTVRKFVPFGEVTDGGYHIPYVLYKVLNKRKFLNIKVTMRNGREHVEQRWAKEFAIEVLPQLTPAELNRLAQAQIAAGSVVPETAE